MSTTVKAIHENGFFKPKEPVTLEEHAEVDVTIPEPVHHDPDDPTGWKAIDRLLGSVRSGLSDISEKHDDYLYGDSHH